MGKTRLLQEFLLRSGDSRTIRAECRLYQAATPYFPFRALLRQALDMEGMEPEDTADNCGHGSRRLRRHWSPGWP